METQTGSPSVEKSYQNGEEADLRKAAAEFLHARGLGTAAIFLLELHRPFVNLGYQSSFLVEPMLAIFPGISFRKWADALLSSQENFAEFLNEIENCKKGEQP